MKLKFYYLFFLLWSYSLYGIPPIDSLYQLLEQTKTNPQKLLTTHLQLADALSKQGDNNKATSHIDTVEKQLTERNFPIIKVHLILTKGLLAYNQYNDEEALALFEEGYQLNQKYQAGFCVDFCTNLSKLTSVLVAEDYLKEGLNCASDIQDTIALQEQFGNLYTREEQYEKALLFYNNNQQLAKSIKDTLVESNAYQDIGGVYLLEGKWKKAVNSYLTSKDLKEKIGDKQGLTDVQHNLAMVYFNQKQYDKSLEYYQKCTNYYNNSKDTAELLEIWSNTASVYIAQKKYNKANTLLNQVLSQLEQFPNPTIALKAQMNLGNIELKKENYPEALALFNTSFQTAQQQEDYFNLVMINNFLGEVYFSIKETKQSIFYYQEALNLSQELNMFYEQGIALYGLYESNSHLGSFQEALDWHKQYTSIKDSLYNVETTTQIAAMQAEYDNLQKEKEIQQLSLENKNISIANKTMALESAFKSKQLYLSLSVIVLLLALLGMLWWYRQQQQKTILLEQQLEELLNEQEIKILETALKAQQKERKHLGKEVHDTIGTILATLHYQHLAGQKAIDDPVLFQKDYQLIGQLIGQAADEVHRIACEMDMGEQFAFELKPAIEHLIESIGATKQFELTFNYTGKSFKLPRNLALTVYRVTREILANVLKHAQATKVVVQIVQTNSKVILAVEDNGRGFDTKTTKEGIGLRSMRERIASLNGNMNIESTPQSGTSVVATIPIMGQLSD